MRPESLFRRTDFFEFSASRKSSAIHAVGLLDANQLRDAAAAQQIFNAYEIVVPILDVDNKRGESREILVDISHDPRRMFFHSGIGSSRIPGTGITIEIPFAGDAELFQVRPNTFDASPPRGHTSHDSLVFSAEMVEFSDAELERSFQSWLDSVTKYLSWHRQYADSANAEIRQAINAAIAGRSARLDSASGVLSRLGIKPKTIAQEPRVEQATLKPNATLHISPTQSRFHLFISYASENRDLAKDLVSCLTGKGLKVWWDKGQITLGDKLSQKIDAGLRESKFGIVIVSRSFLNKKWTDAEIRSLANRAMESGKKVILPVLVDLSHDEFADAYPLLADIVSTNFSGDVDSLATEIVDAIR